MKNLLLLGTILSLFLVVPVYAQDGGDYSCQAGAENDIVALAQSAYDAGEWQEAHDFAIEGQTLCASDVFRYRDMILLENDAQAQLDFYETQAFMDASYPGVTDFGDYSIFMRCVGQGTPTLIFEHALFSSADQAWSDVAPAFEDITQVCTYDRAGAGLSSLLPAHSSRTSQQMVDDLVYILETHNVGGPYIIIGHQVGALNALLFYEQYPDVVVGMVFIEGIPPNYIDRAIDIDPNIPSEGALISSERMDIWASETEAQATGDLGDMPLFIIVAGNAVDEETATSPEVAALWLELQEEYAERSTNSQFVIVEDANFAVMATHPEAVIEAIDWVWEEVTGDAIERE